MSIWKRQYDSPFSPFIWFAGIQMEPFIVCGIGKSRKCPRNKSGFKFVGRKKCRNCLYVRIGPVGYGKEIKPPIPNARTHAHKLQVKRNISRGRSYRQNK